MPATYTDQWPATAAMLLEQRRQREAVIDYCRRNAHPGSSPGKHEACLKVLGLLREERMVANAEGSK